MSRTIVRMSAVAHLARNTSVSLLVSLFLLALALPVWAADKEKDEETLKNAKNVLQEMLTDRNIPPDVLAKADCVIVLPNVKKVGFVVGGSGGRSDCDRPGECAGHPRASRYAWGWLVPVSAAVAADQARAARPVRVETVTGD